jgi:hypothetical protein
MQTFDQHLLSLYRHGSSRLKDAMSAATSPTTCGSPIRAAPAWRRLTGDAVRPGRLDSGDPAD